MLCNTSPLSRDGHDYIEDNDDVGDADNCDHIMVTKIMVIMLKIMLVEMATATRIMTINDWSKNPSNIIP